MASYHLRKICVDFMIEFVHAILWIYFVYLGKKKGIFVFQSSHESFNGKSCIVKPFPKSAWWKCCHGIKFTYLWSTSYQTTLMTTHYLIRECVCMKKFVVSMLDILLMSRNGNSFVASIFAAMWKSSSSLTLHHQNQFK